MRGPLGRAIEDIIENSLQTGDTMDVDRSHCMWTGPERRLKPGRNIYVASSWKNQPVVFAVQHSLRAAGHTVFDFMDEEAGFHWSDVDGKYHDWKPEEYAGHLLSSPVAEAGYNRDMTALMQADAVVLVLPCNRSAHLELGYAVGQNKPTCVMLEPEQVTPELMYRMVDCLAFGLMGVLHWAGVDD